MSTAAADPSEGVAISWKVMFATSEIKLTTQNMLALQGLLERTRGKLGLTMHEAFAVVELEAQLKAAFERLVASQGTKTGEA